MPFTLRQLRYSIAAGETCTPFGRGVLQEAKQTVRNTEALYPVATQQAL